MHLRLAHKLILFALATAVFEGVLIGYFLYAASEKAITGDVLRVNQFKAQEVAEAVQDALRHTATHLRNFVRVMAYAAEPDLLAEGRATFNEVEALARLELVAADGTPALAVAREGGTVALDLAGGAQAVHTLLDRAELAGQSVSFRRGPTGTPDRIVVALALQRDGKQVALCRAHLDVARMTADLYTLVEPAGKTVRVVDAQGEVVFAPPLRPQDLAAGAAGAAGAKATADLAFVQEMLRWKGKRPPARPSYTDAHGRPVAAAWCPVRDVPGLAWYALVEQPAHEAYRELEQLRARLLLYGGLGVFVTILVGMLIVRRVTRPLEELSASARRIGQGDLHAEVQAYARDEIGQLADTLREMRDRLAATYDDLERRVEDRTSELRATTDFLNSVLDSSTEYAIIATDMTWRILTFNEGARRVFGYEPAEIVGQPLERLVPPEAVEQVLGAERERTLRAYGRHEGEGVLCRKSGQRFPARTVVTVRTDRAGEPIGYTVIGRDVTQQKALEDRLRDYMGSLEQRVGEKTAELVRLNEQLVRANRLKSQFLATMSHELRTPLNAIIGFAEAIRDGIPGPPTAEQREFAEDIDQAGHELLNMINKILDLARFEAGAMELNLQPCDLAVEVDDVVRVIRGLARRKRVEVRADVTPRPLFLTADAIKLKQILYNLLSNAVKFSDDGGRVEVQARLLPETVVIRVADGGVGIAPEDQATIFEEFRQVDSSLSRNHEGSGLGLALTRRLVELHGGEVAVESELGKGTVFTVTLLRDMVGEPQA